MKANLPVHQPATLKNQEAHDWLAGLRPDLLIVVAYGLILPREILHIPRYGCWNIHASLLPRWRGAAPIQRAIEAGDEETGVCIMQMDEGLDTGPVLLRQTERIAPDDTGATLHDRLARLGARCLLQCVQRLAQHDLPPAIPQQDKGVTYAAKLEKAEAELDWHRDAISLERKVRAFNPWPVAWCDLAGERTRIWAARALDTPAGQSAGKVVSASAAGIDFSTGQGCLRLLQLQRPGARPVSAREYLNARPLQASPANAGAAAAGKNPGR